MPQRSSLPMYGCRQKFLIKKSAVNQIGLRNTGLVSHDLDKFKLG